MKKYKPRQIRKILLIAVVIGLAVVMTGEYLFQKLIYNMVGMGIIIATVIFDVIFYRCPHCGRFLSKSTGQFCPFCGEDMDEEQIKKEAELN